MAKVDQILEQMEEHRLIVQEFKELQQLPQWGRLVNHLKAGVRNYRSTALEVCSSVDELVSKNAAAARVAALEFVIKLPQSLCDEAEEELRMLRIELEQEQEQNETNPIE